MRGNETREAIVAVADDLFYRQGFDATGFTAVAEAIGISRGNFYYHFRTKDEILDAVIARRLTATNAMLANWDAASDEPAERICAFVQILITNGPKIMAHGCPVGTLCNELAKLDHAALPVAAQIMSLFRDWLARQFSALGRSGDADDLGLQVLSFTQGVATLAMALRDESWVKREVERMSQWVRSLTQTNGSNKRCS